MEVTGQLHDTAAAALGRELPVPTGQEAAWTPVLVWMWMCCTTAITDPILSIVSHFTDHSVIAFVIVL
jgi:hypothetical protein